MTTHVTKEAMTSLLGTIVHWWYKAGIIYICDRPRDKVTLVGKKYLCGIFMNFVFT